MDGVEIEDIIKGTSVHKLEENEQYKKITEAQKEMVQELCKQRQEKESMT